MPTSPDAPCRLPPFPPLHGEAALPVGPYGLPGVGPPGPRQGPVGPGLDGSLESLAAAERAAREARLRGLRSKPVHVRERVPAHMAQAPLPGAGTLRHRSGGSETGYLQPKAGGTVPREAAEGPRARHPGVDVVTEHLDGRPAEVLREPSTTPRYSYSAAEDSAA
ncbi:universal stress protein [Streptomyces sp. NPDC002698]|uniref:universal stress protein n=1 Tax=Streptomyces sp. NPDC002698 TaxID=3364660 RepID=UPI0036B97F4B